MKEVAASVVAREAVATRWNRLGAPRTQPSKPRASFLFASLLTTLLQLSRLHAHHSAHDRHTLISQPRTGGAKRYGALH